MGRRKVLRSIESEDGVLCVDIFERTDGSYGFEEYRKDPEDPRGWFPIGGYSGINYSTPSQALLIARSNIGWLGSVSCAGTEPWTDKNS